MSEIKTRYKTIRFKQLNRDNWEAFLAGERHPFGFIARREFQKEYVFGAPAKKNGYTVAELLDIVEFLQALNGANGQPHANL